MNPDRPQKDPLQALERLKATAEKTKTPMDLAEAIVVIRHGRGNGTYITRWITVHRGEVLEHEQETHGLAALSRLLRDTIRRHDHERIMADVRRTHGYRDPSRGPHHDGGRAAVRGPEERRRQEAIAGIEPAWKIDRDPEPEPQALFE